jgi:tetratricopeptide (TPR) repeat protein
MEVQKMYEECVSSHDPNTIAMLVNQHPYHVDSLLALAELYKHMGEFQRSADLLERCLYVLECAWHPWFNPTTGMCRVDFAHDANKPLFYALFRHMQHLGRRGCHRTALEVCKLLLSLDSDDPLGSLFCIDYFALRAEQYEWLQSFVNVYGKDHSLALLPSFSFSLALSQFHLDAQKSDIISSRYFCLSLKVLKF